MKEFFNLLIFIFGNFVYVLYPNMIFTLSPSSNIISMPSAPFKFITISLLLLRTQMCVFVCVYMRVCVCIRAYVCVYVYIKPTVCAAIMYLFRNDHLGLVNLSRNSYLEKGPYFDADFLPLGI